MNVLVIEDDRDQAEFIKTGLMQKGFVCDCAYDGEEGLYLLMEHDYAVAIVDNMMPKMPGREVIRRVRAGKQNPPIMIMLSQCITEADRIAGLDIGASDYICKPFGMGELIARINAQLRTRYPEYADAILKFDNLVVDTLKKEVIRDGNIIRLEPLQYKLLEYLLRNVGQYIPASLILEQVWDMASDAKRDTVDVRISTLRKKLNAFGRNIIVTRKGIGYGIE